MLEIKNAKRFGDLAKWGIHEISSFHLKRMTGHDDIAAAERAGMNGSISAEVISQAIVAVNDQPVPTPYVDWQDWDSRTLDFVRAAHAKMNVAQAFELSLFLTAHFGSPPTESLSAPSSSATASGPDAAAGEASREEARSGAPSFSGSGRGQPGT